jgi:hypothetical protein
MEKWFHERATMLIFTQIVYFLEILAALRITDQFRRHKYQIKNEKGHLVFHLLPNLLSYIQGVSVNRAILKTSRIINVFIYLVLTHVNKMY